MADIVRIKARSSGLCTKACKEACVGKAYVQRLWGMLYAEEAGIEIVSRSSISLVWRR